MPLRWWSKDMLVNTLYSQIFCRNISWTIWALRVQKVNKCISFSFLTCENYPALDEVFDTFFNSWLLFIFSPIRRVSFKKFIQIFISFLPTERVCQRGNLQEEKTKHMVSILIHPQLSAIDYPRAKERGKINEKRDEGQEFWFLTITDIICALNFSVLWRSLELPLSKASSSDILLNI